MKHAWIFVATLLLVLALAALADDETLPVRGFCIAAPQPDGVAAFVEFIRDELAPAGINTLVVRVDNGFEYRSHPELRGERPLGRSDVKKLVRACREAGIRLIPQINLLGHQSWESDPGRLLEVYPQFDETPWVELPVDYRWPNPDGLYCKSYCPLHPEVHGVVFALIDEIIEVSKRDIVERRSERLLAQH